MPGKGEVVLAEGDPQLSEDEERLVEEFRRQLESGMWAAVPIIEGSSGRREAKRVASEAVRDGLREIGRGPGPVNALGMGIRVG